MTAFLDAAAAEQRYVGRTRSSRELWRNGLDNSRDELMPFDARTLDLGDVEAKIVSFLRSGVDVESNGQPACEQFGIVLAKVLRLLPGDRQTRYWDLDDFWCDSADRVGDVVTLKGCSNWLRGGQDCDRFRLDVALDQEPILYSYKFTNSTTGNQVLYVGKTPAGWLINGP